MPSQHVAGYHVWAQQFFYSLGMRSAWPVLLQLLPHHEYNAITSPCSTQDPHPPHPHYQSFMLKTLKDLSRSTDLRRKSTVFLRLIWRPFQDRWNSINIVCFLHCSGAFIWSAFEKSSLKSLQVKVTQSPLPPQCTQIMVKTPSPGSSKTSPDRHHSSSTV